MISIKQLLSAQSNQYITIGKAITLFSKLFKESEQDKNEASAIRDGILLIHKILHTVTETNGVFIQDPDLGWQSFQDIQTLDRQFTEYLKTNTVLNDFPESWHQYYFKSNWLIEQASKILDDNDEDDKSQIEYAIFKSINHSSIPQLNHEEELAQLKQIIAQQKKEILSLKARLAQKTDIPIEDPRSLNTWRRLLVVALSSAYKIRLENGKLTNITEFNDDVSNMKDNQEIDREVSEDTIRKYVKDAFENTRP